MNTFRSKVNFTPAIYKDESKLKSIIILSQTDYPILKKRENGDIVIRYSLDKKFYAGGITIQAHEVKEFGIERSILTYTEVVNALKRVSFAKSCINFDWGWEVSGVSGTHLKDGKVEEIRGFLINTTFNRPDIHTGKIGIGRGRRMWIEETATLDSIFKTAYVAVDLILKHESMEGFQVDGETPFYPHNDTLDLNRLSAESKEKYLKTIADK